MGPFVPDIISDQLNLIVALVIGFFFGYVLEQAGFSSSRKLAGLFYGYDFTVLRVFFTAAVTAMSGILLMEYFGYLDLSLIYVNPTWLWPAVVGGAVMGAGFILGGFCPGTSIVGAAVGRIDAMVFVGGGLFGVLAFGEAFPWLQNFYESSSLGSVKVYDSLGLSAGIFAFGLILIAVAAFAAVSLIERKVNPESAMKAYNPAWHRFAAASVLLLGVVLLGLPDRQATLVARASEPSSLETVDRMDPDELAFRIVDRDPNLRVLDLRNVEGGSDLPGAQSVTLEALLGRELRPTLTQRHLKKVVVADTEREARIACGLLTEQGYVNVAALGGGYAGFRHTVLEGVPNADPVAAEFRARASSEMARMLKEQRSKASGVKKPTKQIKGGC